MSEGKSNGTPEYKPVELILKKRNRHELSEADVYAFVKNVVSESFPSAQTGAMLMAMYLNGMSSEETVHLTRAMLESGSRLSWPDSHARYVVDKHSTGGVGDKVSLVLAPMLAACGLFVPMISGRSLGYTGGTLDKLESIPGFTVQHSAERMREIVLRVGCCIVGQTKWLVPADKTLYTTRDITGTVESLPLITASIMSKKAAEGLRALTFELTYGKAALVKTEADARQLGHMLLRLSGDLGIGASGLLTRMTSPLGRAVGNALEVAEAVACLQSDGPDDVMHVTVALGQQLLVSTGKAADEAEARKMLLESIDSGAAREKFYEMIVQQGVEPGLADRLVRRRDLSVLPASEHRTPATVTSSGYVLELDGLKCAQLVHSLGAGRQRAEDAVNLAVGLELRCACGQSVSRGDVWAVVHHDRPLDEEQRALLDGVVSLCSDVRMLENAPLTSVLTSD